MIVEVIDPLKHRDWNGLLMTNPDASFFHTKNWARVLFESYGYIPEYFSVRKNGTLVALLPFMVVDSFFTGRRGVSLPFTDYSDPIAADESQYRQIADFAVRYGKQSGWRNIEIRGGCCPWMEMTTYTNYFGHRLSLRRNEKEIFDGFRMNVKRNINKSMKAGVCVTQSSTHEAVEAFYRLNLYTRKAHGIPPQPKKFFRKVQKHVLEKNMGTVVLASHEGRYLAGAVFFHFGSTVFYKYGASHEPGRQLRANNLVMWEAIRYYNEKGYRYFHFGRTDRENPGLREYKKGYGTDEEKISYFKYDLRRDCLFRKKPKRGMIFSKIYRLVPIPLSKLVGTFLYRHIG